MRSHAQIPTVLDLVGIDQVPVTVEERILVPEVIRTDTFAGTRKSEEAG